MIAPADLQTIPPALIAPLNQRPSGALPAALLAALALHLILILVISFELPPPKPASTPTAALEVLILRDKGPTTANPEPDASPAEHAYGGESPQGDTALLAPAELTERTEPVNPEGEGLTTHEPGPQPSAPPLNEPLAARPEPQPPPPVLAAAPAPVPVPSAKVPTPPPPQPDPTPATKPVNAAQILASRDQEIARLSESLEARTKAYAGRQRRKSISASTREFRYASYLAAWARKVENIGNINYPQAAKEQHLYGNLILHVALRADGSVEQIRIVRSSGYDLLDQAAIRIVELGAPYAPFPPDIAAETDLLDIIRTWQFLRGGKLGWE